MDAGRMWCRALGGLAEAERVLVALRKCGLAVEIAAPSTAAPGLVVGRATDPSLCAEVATAASTGARILVVLTGALRAGASPWDFLAAGAADVLNWRDDLAQQVAARLLRWAEVESQVRSDTVRRQLLGDSPAWLRVLRDLVEAGRFSTANVLLLGESGTGKEQAARLVHTLDPARNTGPFVLVDCSAIVPDLAGSEFFGHERGAFTSAAARRDGAFALAHGGTLFLDEVGELPLPAQAQLLRVVQEGTFKRVGGNEWLGVDFRLVAATNRNLRAEVDSGRFRRDLYYRIAGWVCRLPPLRERLGDLMGLARQFAVVSGGDAEQVRFEPAVEQFLLQRDYPGNVRDLRQLVLQMRHRHAGPGPITIGDVPESERPPAANTDARRDDQMLDFWVHAAIRGGLSLKDIARHVEAAAIRCAYGEAGTYRQVAQQLGVSERTVLAKLAGSRGCAEDTQAS